jgi:hypothetical protein
VIVRLCREQYGIDLTESAGDVLECQESVKVGATLPTPDWYPCEILNRTEVLGRRRHSQGHNQRWQIKLLHSKHPLSAAEWMSPWDPRLRWGYATVQELSPGSYSDIYCTSGV